MNDKGAFGTQTCIRTKQLIPICSPNIGCISINSINTAFLPLWEQVTQHSLTGIPQPLTRFEPTLVTFLLSLES